MKRQPCPVISESKLQELLGGDYDLLAEISDGPYIRTVYLRDFCYDLVKKFSVVDFQPSLPISGYWT